MHFKASSVQILSRYFPPMALDLTLLHLAEVTTNPAQEEAFEK